MGVATGDDEAGAVSGERQGFAGWLAARLAERHMTQAELARQLNVQPATVNRWLREFRQPDPRSVEELALVFGLPVDEVMVVAGVLSGERARVGPRARLMDLIARLPDAEVTTVLAFAEFRMEQYRQLIRVTRARNTSETDVSGGNDSSVG